MKNITNEKKGNIPLKLSIDDVELSNTLDSLNNTAESLHQQISDMSTHYSLKLHTLHEEAQAEKKQVQSNQMKIIKRLGLIDKKLDLLISVNGTK